MSQDTEHFLLNPFGMLYSEVSRMTMITSMMMIMINKIVQVTASSLVKVNMQGETVEEGTTNFGVNQAGFMLHSAIHQARPDIKAIIHLHTPNIVAVSFICNYKSSCLFFCDFEFFTSLIDYLNVSDHLSLISI